MSDHIELKFEVSANDCLECGSPHSNWRIVFFADNVGAPFWACSQTHAMQIIEEWMSKELDGQDPRGGQSNGMPNDYAIDLFVAPNNDYGIDA